MDASSVISRKGRLLTRRRFADGSYENEGIYTPSGPPVDAKIFGSVQPMGVREKLLMPEGDRTREWIKVFTTDDLRTDSETARADVLVVDGRLYEVQQVTDWMLPTSGARLTHREVNAVSVNEKTIA
jgi:hypothetical protein